MNAVFIWRSSFALLSLILSLCAHAQRAGLLIADARYAKVPLLPSYSGVKYNEAPIRVSLRKYCPVPGDQRQTGACVGWAVGYGALTIMQAIQEQKTDQAAITRQARSAAYVYNQILPDWKDCEQGAYLEDALALVQREGACLEAEFPFDKFGCVAQPDEQLRAKARSGRIQDYAAVFALDEEPKSKIGKACKILATQTPVIVGLAVAKSFFDLPPGAGYWAPGAEEEIIGFHALVLIGYNSVERQFEFLNSFGASWGQGGFFRLNFDDFARLCRYAYVMAPGVAEDQSPVAQTNDPAGGGSAQELSGEFVFRRPAGFVTTSSGEELPYFEEVGAHHLTTDPPGLYRTEREYFEVGEVFQLVARNIPRGRYAYIFSQSPDGSVNIHFPRRSERFAGAGFVLEKTAEIVIPAEDLMLQIPAAGEDYLCIIYSMQPIPDFERRVKVVELMGAKFFPEKVNEVFTDMFLPPSHILYERKRMAFNANVNSGKGLATAIFLRVEAR
ncbi:MAG: C1 family peptidase [Saprospiraceae bacterium]